MSRPDFTCGRRIRRGWRLLPLALVTCLAPSPVNAADAAEGTWLPLFNGRDLSGWIPKIKGYPVGENFGETFRVADGAIQVRYDQYRGRFAGRFGHLFYQTPYAHYRLRLEYRFLEPQYPEGSPGWAVRNSGIMIHGQSPESMRQDQDFPVSIEVQLLGGDGVNPRTTGNLCTPGTNVVLDGELRLEHCLSSRSPTFHGDQWVTAEVEVRGNQLVKHRINGEEVLAYAAPQLDPRDADAAALLDSGQPKLLAGGSISLQSESHPVDFRKVEIMELQP